MVTVLGLILGVLAGWLIGYLYNQLLNLKKRHDALLLEHHTLLVNIAPGNDLVQTPEDVRTMLRATHSRKNVR